MEVSSFPEAVSRALLHEVQLLGPEGRENVASLAVAA